MTINKLILNAPIVLAVAFSPVKSIAETNALTESKTFDTGVTKTFNDYDDYDGPYTVNIYDRPDVVIDSFDDLNITHGESDENGLTASSGLVLQNNNLTQDDDKKFGGKLLAIHNLNITSNNLTGGYGLFNRSMNTSVDGLKITQGEKENVGYTAIEVTLKAGDGDRFSSLAINNALISVNAQKGIGLRVSGSPLFDESHAAEGKLNNSTINLNGEKSTGVLITNGDAVIANSQIKLLGAASAGAKMYVAGNLTLDNTSITSAGDEESIGISSIINDKDYGSSTYNDDARNVVIKNNSVLNFKNGTGFVVNTKDFKAEIDNSIINSRVLLRVVDPALSDVQSNVNAELNAANSSVLIGSVNTGSGLSSIINLTSGSIWNVTGDSNLTNLKTDASTVNFTKDGDNFTTTQVDNVMGNNGTYTFAVDVAGQEGSKLIINQSSDGTYIAQALNDGAQNTTGNEKITLIEDNSGTNSKAIFNSGKDTELGGYLYRVQRDSENPNNWVLAGNARKVNDTAKTITGLASTSYLMNLAEMSTLRERMGELTRSSGAGSSKKAGAWGRMFGGNYKTRSNDNLAAVDMNYYGFQFGGDFNTAHYSNNKNYLGMFMGHTTGKPNYVRGDATATSWYGGFYDTFVADSGFYVDSVVKMGQYRNNYNLKDSQNMALNGKAQSSVITLSSQVGKRFNLTENDNYNIYVEPQAQLTYSRIGAFNTTASNGLHVKQDGYNSTISRFGALLGTQINKKSDIYVKTSYLHEFSKDVKYSLNDSPESYSVKGNGLEAGMGINAKMNDNGYMYAEGDYINSKSHYTGSKFNIGYRYSF